MTWENVKTLLQIVEMAHEHGPLLKDLRDQALATIAALDPSDFHFASQAEATTPEEE